ncbi:MAG: histidinol dehydrogenase [Methanomassiliicoccales archaeon]
MPYEIRPIGLDDWLKRRSQNLDQVMDGVSDIIEKVRIRGDAALIELTEKFDGIKLSSLKIEKENLRKAFDITEEMVHTHTHSLSLLYLSNALSLFLFLF